MTDIARSHGCRPQQVHAWRRMARLGQLVLPASADTVSFVPLVSESLRPPAAEPSGSSLRGRSAAERQAHARPLAIALKQWFEAKLGPLSQKGETAKALRYALRHWDGLTLYLDDGRIEMDTNAVERAMRPIKLNAKNALFAGCDEGAENWAMLASLIETCKLNDVNADHWLADVLEKLVNGWGPPHDWTSCFPGHRPTPYINRIQGWRHEPQHDRGPDQGDPQGRQAGGDAAPRCAVHPAS